MIAIYVAKTMVEISCAGTAWLICTFVFAYAKSQISHDATHIILNQENSIEPVQYQLSLIMRKAASYICENKGADQLKVSAQLISGFVLAMKTVQQLYFLNQTFQASGVILCLYIG